MKNNDSILYGCLSSSTSINVFGGDREETLVLVRTYSRSLVYKVSTTPLYNGGFKASVSSRVVRVCRSSGLKDACFYRNIQGTGAFE